jgi:hypothetical protein
VGASGTEVCGVSEVVAKVLSGVLDRGTAFNVEDEKRHRDRGIEAAIVVCVNVQKREEKSEGAIVLGISWSTEP